jgi:hypothetical protein
MTKTQVRVRCSGLTATYWRTSSLPPRPTDGSRVEPRRVGRSAFVAMRAAAPLRPLSLAESLALAESQADILLRFLSIDLPPLPTTALTSLPRIRVRRFADLPVSAFAQWDRTHWLIGLNSSEPETRRRFSLAHEIKHIVDSPLDFTIYARLSYRDREKISDHFAACALMPAVWVKRLGSAPQDIRGLARTFGVSPLAMRVRLTALRLIDTERRFRDRGDR